MTRVNEFRLSNIITQNGKTTIIDSLERSPSDWERTNHKRTMDTKGIEITNDWLVKLGFQLYPSGYFCLNLNDKNTYLSIGSKHHRKINLIIEQEGVAFSTELNHINFVHEIQNLFFAFTGREVSFLA